MMGDSLICKGGPFNIANNEPGPAIGPITFPRICGVNVVNLIGILFGIESVHLQCM